MEYFTVPNIIITILVAILVIMLYILRNLLIKVEKYEEVTEDQTKYLQNVSNAIGKANSTCNSWIKRGSFKATTKLVNFLTK